MRLSTHLVVLFGLAGMVAWLGELERVLPYASVDFGALTLFLSIATARAANATIDNPTDGGDLLGRSTHGMGLIAV